MDASITQDPLVWVSTLIGIAVALAGVMLYNRLVRSRMHVREAWSTIEVQLERRASLVPNLVAVTKGYAAHERDVFERVTQARAQLAGAGSPASAAEANTTLTAALRSLFAVAEAYPQLKADATFLQLQAQLAETEDKIAYARTYYNSRVLQYNSLIQTVPSALVAQAFAFAEAEFFGSDEEATDVQVTFS